MCKKNEKMRLNSVSLRTSKIIFLCIYKMVKISAETFGKNCFYNLIDKEKKSWPETKDIKKRLGLQNIHDLVHKETKGKFETKNPTK